MTLSHITLKSKLSLLQNIYNSFATSEHIGKQRTPVNEPWYIRIDQIYFNEAPAVAEKVMLALHLVDEFGMPIPEKENSNLKIAIQTLNQSPETWDAGLKKYGENEDVKKLISQLLSFIPELERAMVNIVAETL